ncbi:uncharacterized protein MYCFIDRAFT_153824 [Pseudocercospora fijiensis CIRAD86]|uniref:Uncharacterized protein n=1 Tax=Pseudocercospora fijiensis (strain CIRAD86) TaxID=383855 RepID=M2Z027_PSEFD|nr:uncharacterized protein MYCFIDRAFT_153824 [Pseudocercospora fijiensis CIRAD86]EME83210.1 hypothetical protein MYCFIDRAFT_153824 [Pseudocercospora fijiensis CIRAD86]
MPPQSTPKHILDLLQRAAESGSGTGIRYLDKGLNESASFVLYAQLYQRAKDNASRLLEAGVVKNGSTVITYFDTHSDNVLWFWSVVAAGGVCAVLNPVSNEPKTAAGQLDNLRALFGSTPILTSHKLSSIIASRKLNVVSVEGLGRRQDSGLSSPTEPNPIDSHDIAAILFTSGSTGHSKAVKFSHAQLIESVRAKSAYLSTKGRAFMSWVSFDHSACFCEVHLHAIFNGDDQVFVPTTELVSEPWRFFQVLSDNKIGYTFSPNFFLAAAAESFSKQGSDALSLDLSNLSTIMCGGEANRTKTLAAVDEVLKQYGAPPHSIKAAYGLSETCSACFYNLESPDYDVANSNTFASVGKPLPGLECKIVPTFDDAESEQEGVIHLRGPVIFMGYHNNEAATSACMTEDNWMNTGDIGRFDENGNLQLLGRAKEVLILNGNNYSSFELEYAIESSNIAGLTPSFTAVFSTWDQERDSEAPVVLFNPTEDAIGPKNLRATLRAIDKAVFSVCAQKALHIIPLPKSQLPKSTIGKLSRAKLRQSFEKGLFGDYIIDNAQTLFLLHPGAGEFLCWIGLLKYLPDRPIYALRAKGLHPGEGTFDSLDELLDTYYKAIRRTQPKGPYAMLGYCFGGLLAFELTKRFEAEGEQVLFCGGIDNPPSLKSTIGQVRYRSLMIDLLPVVSKYTEDEARAFAEETADLSDEDFYALLFNKFSPRFIESMDITVPRLQAFGRVEDCMRLMAANYDPEGQVATADIFCADPMPHFGATPEAWRSDVLSGWKSYVKDQNVRFHEVLGTHISLIKEPLIEDFQRILNEALAGRGI